MGGLVAIIQAVRYLVAHQRRVDALPVGAPELIAGARGDVFAGTVKLIRVVAAIVFVVAPISVANAFEVLARKLPRRARLVLRVTVFALVRAIAAVIVVIAHPSLVDTPSVAARELIGTAVYRRRTVQRRCVLVRAVHTVRVTIAQPLFRYTLRSVPRFVRHARELRGLVTFSIVCKAKPKINHVGSYCKFLYRPNIP